MGKHEKIETMDAFWQLAERMEQGFVFAMFTDGIVFERWPFWEEGKSTAREALERFRTKEEKLLDIRLFNREKELRMFRGNIGGTFLGRVLEDEPGLFDEAVYFDEEQYLDIDTKRSETLFAGEGKVRATGGGIYRLPLKRFENAKVKVRNYLGYYENTGQAYVKDWRLVELIQEEGES